MIAAAVAVLTLLAVPAASASDQAKAAKREAKKEPQAVVQAPRRGNGYVEQLADKMKFGSSAWWEQMRREGRLGGETP
jgi:hypothetical protein